MKKHSLAIAAGLLTAVAAHAGVPDKLLGDSAAAGDATRTISIAPSTRYVNVAHGDVVRFDINGGQYAYRFDGAEDVSNFDLRRILPEGTLDHAVRVYIAPDQYDVGG